MSRIRSVKPEWLDDELVFSSSDARVLSIVLILLADDYGNGRAHPVYLLSRAFPGKAPEVLTAALDELLKLRYVTLYEVDGQKYFQIRNWSKHQRVDKPGKPSVPAPPIDDAKPRKRSAKPAESNCSVSANSPETPEKIPGTPARDSESLAPDQEGKGEEGKGEDPAPQAAPPTPRSKTRATTIPSGFADKLTARQIAHAQGKGYYGWWAKNRFLAFCGAAKAKGLKYVDWDQALFNAWDRELNEWGNTPEKLRHLAPRGWKPTAQDNAEAARRQAEYDARVKAEAAAHHAQAKAELEAQGALPLPPNGPPDLKAISGGIGG